MNGAQWIRSARAQGGLRALQDPEGLEELTRRMAEDEQLPEATRILRAQKMAESERRRPGRSWEV